MTLKGFGIRLVSKIYCFLLALRTTLMVPAQRRKRADFLLDFRSEAQLDQDNQAMRAFAPMEPQLKKASYDKICIALPFRDGWKLTLSCLESICKQDMEGLEVTVRLVDNDSKLLATREGLQKFLADSQGRCNGLKFEYLKIPGSFNFSRISNIAFGLSAEETSTQDAFFSKPKEFDFFLLLNNDVELLQADTLKSLVAFANSRPRCGALGCTLLYPGPISRVQHFFVAPGVKIVGAHPGKSFVFDPRETWYSQPRCVASVTGALLLVKAKTYFQVDGLDEDLPTAYQDVDFCLKLLKNGLTNWVLPNVVAIHHESATRKKKPAWAEAERMYDRWGEFLTKNPYVSTKLSRWSERPLFSWFESDFPWRLFKENN